MKILMISAILPSPYTPHSIPTRTFNLMKNLSKRHQITLVAQHYQMAKDTHIEALREWIEDLVIFPQNQEPTRRGIVSRAKRLGQLLKAGTPQSVLSYYSPEMQQWIDEKVREKAFDVITCEHSINETYVRSEWQNQVRTVINIHGSIYGTCQKYLDRSTAVKKSLREQLNLPLLRRYEQNYCSKFSPLQAMAVGVPLVANDRALEGLKVDGATVNLAAMRSNRLEEYIYAIGRLFKDKQLREKLSQNARNLVEKNHNWQRITEQYEKILTANVNHRETTRSLS